LTDTDRRIRPRWPAGRHCAVPAGKPRTDFRISITLPGGILTMLRLAILFAVIALIAGALGFYGLSDVSANIAKFFALLFAILFVVALIAGARIFGPSVT
jgi:uncharacterized membrane protein YtjA (UPF0391 family)